VCSFPGDYEKRGARGCQPRPFGTRVMGHDEDAGTSLAPSDPAARPQPGLTLGSQPMENLGLLGEPGDVEDAEA